MHGQDLALTIHEYFKAIVAQRTGAQLVKCAVELHLSRAIAAALQAHGVMLCAHFQIKSTLRTAMQAPACAVRPRVLALLQGLLMQRMGHHASSTPSLAELAGEDAVSSSLVDGKEASLPSRGVRRKYFAMPAMSLDEALHQLELIDHDFYLFRDAASGELQVVYRRNHGGFGVIQAKG